MSHPRNFKEPNTPGIWNDHQHNSYVADYSGKKVKRVSPQGKVDVNAYSKSPWSPVGGLIDDQENLWILENDVSNRVQVRKINKSKLNSSHFKLPVWINALPLAVLIAMLSSFYVVFLKNRPIRLQNCPCPSPQSSIPHTSYLILPQSTSFCLEVFCWHPVPLPLFQINPSNHW